MQIRRFQQSLKHNRTELIDAVYLILLQGVNQLLPIFVMPYLMKTLGATGYGYIGYSLSVIQYLTIVVDFGFNLSATKHIAQVADDEEARSRVFWNVVAAKSLLLGSTLLILTLLVVFVPTFQVYGKAILATAPMLVGSAFTFMWFFQGIGRIRMFSVLNTVSKLALLPLIFVFVKTSDDYVLAACLQALVFVSTALFSNLYLVRCKLVDWHLPKWQQVRREIAVSFPLFLSSASTSVYTQLIVVVLGFCCTTEEIGKYSSADRIMRALCFLLYTPLSQVFFPRISMLAAKAREESLSLFRQVRALVLLVMVVLGVTMWMGSGWLPAFLGSDYAGLDVYLRIFALVPIAIGIGGVYGQMGLVALGNESTNRRFRDVYFLAALAALVLMGVLIPLFHAVGASIVVVATELIVACLMVYNLKKYLSQCW